MTVGELGEEVAQVSIGLYAVHLAGSDEACEARPRTAALIVAGKKRVAAIHGRAADGVLDQVGVHVDMAIFEEELEAASPPQHVGKRHTKFGFARDARSLGGQPGEELIHQRARQFLADRPTMLRR